MSGAIHEPFCTALTDEQRAFAEGKRAASAGRLMHTCTHRKPVLREAWLRGWRFAHAHRDGLRPLDTARRTA